MSLDPSNADALTVLALLDQVEAQKSAEASQRGRLRANAYEYCMLAASIDSTCCTALNHMANYCSHIWKTVSSHRIRKGEKGNARYDLSECAVVSSERVIATKKAGVKDVTLCQGDHIRVRLLDVERNDKHGHAFIECSIESVASVDGGSKGSDSRNTIEGPKLTLSIELPSHFVGKPVLVDTKEMGRAIKLANEAISNSQVGGVKAEGYYIVGKVHHAQGNIDSALLCYRKSLEFEDLMLAAFGVATIQLVKGDYEKSLGLFERVLAAHPTDKDTLAYCILLRALHRQESEDFDKVKEVAPGFQFEIDMWLLQGQTRLKKPQEYFTALKCYNTALECMRLKGIAADPMIYSNVAVLYHSLGKLNQALEYSKRALTAVEDSIVKSPDKDDAYTNPPFRNADLEGVFYKWSSPVCALVLDDASTEDADAASPSVGRFLVDRGEGAAEVDLTLAVTTGDDVVIGDVVYTVESVEASKLTARSPVHRLMRHSAADKTFTFQYKELWHNFGDDYVTLSYNLARIMEDAGLTRAAMEVYAELLKKHASFMECYLRLSRIERDLGKFDEASRWLSKALAVNDEQPDINISLGDLYSQGSSWEAAKRCYEKVCGKVSSHARKIFVYRILRT
jgi:tetratricopeptide (TPR) repeat protein